MPFLLNRWDSTVLPRSMPSTGSHVEDLAACSSIERWLDFKVDNFIIGLPLMTLKLSGLLYVLSPVPSWLFLGCHGVIKFPSPWPFYLRPILCQWSCLTMCKHYHEPNSSFLRLVVFPIYFNENRQATWMDRLYPSGSWLLLVGRRVVFTLSNKNQTSGSSGRALLLDLSENHKGVLS